jgi:F0F1-type ATP synthase assembly protein I
MTGTMLSGLIVWGGAGWWLDQWLDTRVFVLVGMILGLTASIYLVVVKYGRLEPIPAPARRRTTPGGRQGHSGTQKGQR